MKTGLGSKVIWIAGTVLAFAHIASAQRTITADVVALDQAFYNNRLGAFQAGGMIFALRQDVVNNTNPNDPNLTAGKVMLRADKRPRPMVLRMNLGDCLQVNFQNLLADVPSLGGGGGIPFNPANLKTNPDPDPVNSLTSQPATRLAGVHVMGMEPKQTIGDDASWIGANPDMISRRRTRRRPTASAPPARAPFFSTAPPPISATRMASADNSPRDSSAPSWSSRPPPSGIAAR